MKNLFGTDGIRGVAGQFPLDSKTLAVIGWSLARRMSEKLGRPPRLLSGRDTRESGAWIEKAFHNGAAFGGAVCESADVITTPGIAFLTGKFGFDAGIVVSASHNPYEDNGIKVFAPSGRKIESTAERLIEEDIFSSGSSVEGLQSAEVDSSRSAVFHAAYLEYLGSGFSSLDLTGQKLVLDCANGAASGIAPLLFRNFSGEVQTIHNKPDGRNINKDCGSLHLDQLQARVKSENADFGVAFDGDADRALFVDENGSIVDGDGVLWVLANYFRDHGRLAKDRVVATVMSNIGLEIALNSLGIGLTRTAVGDKYVLEELISSGTSIGGEQSGHIIIPDRSLVGDGMMTALFLLEAMFEKRAKLSELMQGFTRYPQVLINVAVREKRPFESVLPIMELSEKIEKELNGKGRLLLRYSGTENLARVMIEGQDQKAIESQAEGLALAIASELGN